jgi:hypothetical protein
MSNNFFERFIKANKPETPSLTFKEEQRQKEEQAVAFEQGRKAQASKFPNATVSNEQHPGFKAEITDAPRLINKASNLVDEMVTDLVGKGGFTVELDEFREIKSHKDIKDHSTVNDEAIIAFKVDFTVPGSKIKTAKLLVSHKLNSDTPLKVESVFYDNDNKEHELSSVVLTAFLENKMENTVKMANVEKPLAWFNPELGNYELVQLGSTSVKVASRLAASGFEVTSRWVDTCHGPKTFGKVCNVVEVPLDRKDEFCKIAAWSDDEWVNRTNEKSYKDGKDLSKDENWVDRAQEKAGYDKPDLKKDSNWVDRAQEKGPKGNPYNTEGKMMAAGSKDEAALAGVRKEAVNKALASTNSDLSGMISDLESKI